MLIRKQSAQKVDKDWFAFSAPLAFVVATDYLSLRLLLHLEPLTTAFTTLSKGIEVAEKSLKLFVTVLEKSPSALSKTRSDYGHNIEKLRSAASAYNSAFGDADVVAFSKDLNDKNGKLYQHIRYGSEETTDGFSADTSQLLPVIDKIFYESILGLPPNERRLLFFVSPIKNLIQNSRFDQTRNRNLLIQALRAGNPYFDDIAKYCAQLDAEHAKLAAELQAAAGTSAQQV